MHTNLKWTYIVGYPSHIALCVYHYHYHFLYVTDGIFFITECSKEPGMNKRPFSEGESRIHKWKEARHQRQRRGGSCWCLPAGEWQGGGRRRQGETWKKMFKKWFQASSQTDSVWDIHISFSERDYSAQNFLFEKKILASKTGWFMDISALQWLQSHKVFQRLDASTLVVLILFRSQTRKEGTNTHKHKHKHQHTHMHTHTNLTTQWHTHITHFQACMGHARRQTQKPFWEAVAVRLCFLQFQRTLAFGVFFYNFRESLDFGTFYYFREFLQI